MENSLNMARAAFLTQYKAPLEIREHPLPRSLEAGAALVRVQMSGVCGTDVHLWHGQLPIPLPVILGHETVGVIERLGDGLKKDWAGQDVAAGARGTGSFSLVLGP